ncbi:LPS assembly lipoprotein LptE [Tunturiibacter gelidiferens]|uniref:LPS assembly lipoprotein LptE n=1 Tax=Tunturiibacter gelidiferens TaxID=3069689 RepID=UPI003D9B735F
MRLLTPILLLTLTGCGYHQAGSATNIPASVRTLAVPVFATNAQAFRTETAFTQATIRELNTRTKYHILTSDSDSADATLHGTILTQTVAPSPTTEPPASPPATSSPSPPKSSSPPTTATPSTATTPSSTASSTNPLRTSAASSRKITTPSTVSQKTSPRP